MAFIPSKGHIERHDVLAWLTRVFGMRNLLLACGTMFMLFSIACGLSDSLPMMVVGRVGQGFAGGALIPTAQTIVATRLPRRLHVVGMAVFAFVGLAGPVLGPLIGGWLAENASWRWCFFINLPAGVTLIALLLAGLPRERGDLGLIAHADWLGIVGLTLGLGSLTVVLEEGQRERWFESAMIVDLSITSALGMALLLATQVTSRDPVVKLALLRNRSYASALLMVTAVASVYFGVIYLLPQFLGQISGYNASQSGAVALLGGVPTFALVGVMPTLLARLDLRLLVGVGLSAMAVSCFMDVNLTTQSAGADFTASQLLRGVGQVLVMFSLNQASIGSVDPKSAGDAAGLYSIVRNLGGSMGLAMFGALIDRRTSEHVAALRESVTANSPTVHKRLGQIARASLGAHGDAGQAQLASLGQFSGEILRQATVMAFADAFWIQGALLALCLPLLLIFKPPKVTGAGIGGH